MPEIKTKNCYKNILCGTSLQILSREAIDSLLLHSKINTCNMRIYRGKDKYSPENGKHNNTQEYGKNHRWFVVAVQNH